MTGQRVFAAIGFVAAGAALLLYGNGAIELPYNQVFKLFNWYAMLTLPMFIYMGYILAESGIAEDLYKMMHVWVGRIPGGLAMGTILVMVIISAMNGLSVAGMAIGATIALPEMLRRGYDKVLISGVVQGGSSLGILIPPSVVLVLYGMIARQPVSKLWFAGLMPGLLMATMFIIYIVIRAKLNPKLAPPVPTEELNMPFREKLALAKAGIIPFADLLLHDRAFRLRLHQPGRKLGRGGHCATLAAILKGRFSWRLIRETSMKTLAVSCMFMWLILAALAFGAVFDGLGAVKAIESLFITQWELSPWMIIIMMQLSFLILGMFLDDTAMLVIVAPLYIPLVASLDLGFDNQLIWYGVLYTITCQIAYITPPFGYNLFLMRSLAPKEISLGDIYRSIWPFAGDDDADDHPSDDLPADRAVAARADQRQGMSSTTTTRAEEAHSNREKTMTDKKPLSPSEAILASRRNFLRQSVVGAGAVAGATLAAPYVNAQSAPIKWRLQTYSGAPLGAHVIKPQIDAFNAAANGEMEIELYYADQLVPTADLFRALQNGTLDAVQSDEATMASPVDISVFGGYFPFATRFSLDVAALFRYYGLKEIWEEAYSEVEGVTWLSTGAWDPLHIFTVDKPIRSLADMQGLRVFGVPTAGKFLSQVWPDPGDHPVGQRRSRDADRRDWTAWHGAASPRPMRWAGPMSANMR